MNGFVSNIMKVTIYKLVRHV